MSKIKVIQHSKTVGLSGTDRTAALFAKYLNKKKYDVYLLYREPDSANCRLDVVKKWLGEDKVIPYHWIPGKKTHISPYSPEEDNFYEVVSKISPDIFHGHWSGYHEWPMFKWLMPSAKIVTTNIFGYKDDADQSDQIIYISEFNRKRALSQGEKDGPVLPNPIEWGQCYIPFEKEFAKKKFNLNIEINPDKYRWTNIWCLRVGRPDNPDPIAIKAFCEVLKVRPFIQYLIVGPCAQTRQYAKDIPNIHFIDQVTDDDDLGLLHSAADIYLHYRHDGEICSTAIQQAMMYGLPIISHKSKIYNGQVEMLQDVGYCVDNSDEYAKILLDLVDDIDLRNVVGRKANDKARGQYEASLVTKKLEAIYDQVLKT